MTWAALCACVALMAPAVPASAGQSPLADLAKKESERRKGIQAPSKVYTNDDLKKTTTPLTIGATSPGVAAEAGATGAAPADAVGEPGSPPKPATDDADAEAAEGGEAQWRARMEGARQELDRTRLFGEALQSRINGLWQDFTARDDYAQREVIAQERAKAIAELDRVRAEMKALTQKIEDIEEEARRAGVPPGWLR